MPHDDDALELAASPLMHPDAGPDAGPGPDPDPDPVDEAARWERAQEVHRALRCFRALLPPVLATMASAAWIAVHVRTEDSESALSAGLDSYLVYDDDGGGGGSGSGGGGGDDTAAALGHSAVNAIAIIGGIALATFVIVGCIKFRCEKVLAAYICLSWCLVLFSLGGFVVSTACEAFSVPADAISYYFLLANFAAGGPVAVFYGTPGLSQLYLVAIAVLVAWELAALPAWTTWSLLVALALWDLFAVLAPCGPLKMLVEMMQERGDAAQVPGLLYEAQLGDDGPAAAAAPAPAPAPAQSSIQAGQESDALLEGGAPAVAVEVVESDSVRLGMGDFVFYSVLVSRAAFSGTAAFVACSLAVIVGLAGTMLLLAVAHKALPALPISNILGVATFLAVHELLEPYLAGAAGAGVVV